jgi:hypothetical protein
MKIEFDIPEFEKELSVTIVIRKDGEVVCERTTSPTTEDSMVEKKEKKLVTPKKSTGNMMDQTDIF